MLRYSSEKNILILLSLLKKHNIRRAIVSPGVNNMNLVASLQNDDYFIVYSCVDERSAAYMACGMAVESKEPVLISCTGATASRNYLSALTEAYYRKIHILAVTSTKRESLIGQNSPQMIDRRVIQNDVARKSVNIPIIHNETEEKDCSLLINDALLELRRNGGGPVHINLTSDYSRDYSVVSLPDIKAIYRVGIEDEFPDIPEGNIAIYVAAHRIMSERLCNAINNFCKKYDAVVLSNHISNYYGEYKIFSNLITYQSEIIHEYCRLKLMIYIGDIDGNDYQGIIADKVWRVNEDGEIRNCFGGTEYVFDMPEHYFFEKYSKNTNRESTGKSIKIWKNEYNRILNSVPELPFSNIWIAQNTLPVLRNGDVIHFGIQNSLRSWSFFDSGKKLEGYCNTGGFGIDGSLSTVVGASLCNPNKLYYIVLGDLSFFYDMNIMGNRHIGKNLRIILINNGLGQQFKNPDSSGEIFGSLADKFIAAGGHFGKKSRKLVKQYAEELGFRYFHAESKDEYISVLEVIKSDHQDKSLVIEAFLNSEDESEAMRLMKNIDISATFKTKKAIAGLIGDKNIQRIKRIIDKRG